MSEEYNGWSNWETWSVDVLLSNDEGLYRETLALIAEAGDREHAIAELEQYVRHSVPRDGIAGVDLNVVGWSELVEAWQDV